MCQIYYDDDDDAPWTTDLGLGQAIGKFSNFIFQSRNYWMPNLRKHDDSYLPSSLQ